MLLFFFVLGMLLIGNWFFTETLVFFPIKVLIWVTSFGWWGLALVTIIFVAWCIGED